MRGKGELHRILSEEAIRILAGVYGAGRSLRVPRSTANAGSLEILIGLPETAQLVHAFGGTVVYLPGLPPPDGRRRGPTLEELEKIDASPLKPSAREIAGRFGCSVRIIYTKRATIRERRKSHEREATDDPRRCNKQPA
jgi:hypothetical protein